MAIFGKYETLSKDCQGVQLANPFADSFEDR
jgi:hypothetical protein